MCAEATWEWLWKKIKNETKNKTEHLGVDLERNRKTGGSHFIKFEMSS